MLHRYHRVLGGVVAEGVPMKAITCGLLAVTLVAAGAPVIAGTLKCPAGDSVKVGNACIDLYEASVWQVDPTNKSLVKKIQAGKADLADLTGGGATQLAPAFTCSGPTDYGVGFPNTGNWTPISGSSPPSPGIYAVSIPGVLPSACMTWFQANQACLLSGKHLATNREWQGAAAGTPDPGTDNGTTDCDVGNGLGGLPVNTGSRSSCKSAWGVFDMVGNVSEWVADWVDQSDSCTHWSGAFGNDLSCFGGPGSSVSNLPGARIRGGSFDSGTDAGVFAVRGLSGGGDPTDADIDVGFRCAR